MPLLSPSDQEKLREAFSEMIDFAAKDLAAQGWKELTTFLLADDRKHRMMVNKLTKRFGFRAYPGTLLIKEL